MKFAGSASYEEYINSPWWRGRRARYYAAHPRRCYVCECERPIFLHHRSYRNIGCETDRDLIPLCGRCHSLLHQTRAGLDKIVNRMRRAYLDGGEKALKPVVIRTRKIRVLDANRLSEAERAKYALEVPEGLVRPMPS